MINYVGFNNILSKCLTVEQACTSCYLRIIIVNFDLFVRQFCVQWHGNGMGATKRMLPD